MLTQKTKAQIVTCIGRALCAVAVVATAMLGMSGVPVQAQSCVTQPSGLVSWWLAENNANDVMGVNNGTALNGTTLAAGKVGQAFSFDGVDDFVQVPNSASLNFSPNAPMSIEFWAFRTGNASIMHMVGKRIGCNGGDGINYQLALNTATSEGLSFGGSAPVNSGVNLPLNTWTHLAGTFDGTTLRLYMNGSLIASGPGTLGPTNTQPLKIGASGDCAPFAGRLDEVSLYNRALTATEIQDIYNAGSGGKCGSSLPPSIIIGDATVSEGNAGTTNPTFTVTRSGDTSGTSTVDYATADDTATQPDDYTSKSGTLTFSPGETSITFTVPVIGDTTYESTERFFVNLSNASNAIIRDNQGIGTITNDDSPPTKLFISDVQILEGDFNNRAMYFTLSLSGPASAPVTVTATTTGQPGLSNPASAPGDFQGTTSTITFAPGEISKSLPVFIVGDTVAEADENFAVKISSASAVTITKAIGIGTIVNDDGPGAASLSNEALSPNNVTSAAGAEQKFMSTQRDSTGNANIDFSRMLVGSPAAPVLYAQYNAQTNLLYLRNDANTAFIGGFAPGSVNVISNSHGSLNCANAQVMRNGTELVIVWALTPTASSAGTHDVLLYAHDLAGLTANFEKKGTWTITSAPALTATTSSNSPTASATVSGDEPSS